MSDYEQAIIKTIASRVNIDSHTNFILFYLFFFQFPNAKHSGCFFHFTQCLYRRIQALGLSACYNNDPEIRSLCRHLMALPLLPVEDVQQAFAALSEDVPEELKPLFEYFDHWWMKKVPLRLWNVSSLKAKTNNNVECKTYFLFVLPYFLFLLAAWHSRFNKRIEKNHPNFWTFLNVLKQEEIHFKQQLVYGNSGKLKRSSKKTCAMQTKFKELRKRYDGQTVSLTEYHNELSKLIGTK